MAQANVRGYFFFYPRQRKMAKDYSGRKFPHPNVGLLPWQDEGNSAAGSILRRRTNADGGAYAFFHEMHPTPLSHVGSDSLFPPYMANRSYRWLLRGLFRYELSGNQAPFSFRSPLSRMATGMGGSHHSAKRRSGASETASAFLGPCQYPRRGIRMSQEEIFIKFSKLY